MGNEQCNNYAHYNAGDVHVVLLRGPKVALSFFPSPNVSAKDKRS